MPLVILEGPDGSGKSTLAARLLKGTGLPTILIKRSGRPAKHETLTQMADWIRDQAFIWGLNTIADRHPLISDHIYSIAVRNEPSLWALEDIVKPLLDTKVLIIYCRTIEGRMFEASHVEKQMEGVHESYHQLVNVYDSTINWLRRAGVRVINYDNLLDSSGAAMVDAVGAFWRGEFHG